MNQNLPKELATLPDSLSLVSPPPPPPPVRLLVDILKLPPEVGGNVVEISPRSFTDIELFDKSNDEERGGVLRDRGRVELCDDNS